MASYEKLPSGRYRGVYHDSSGKKRHVKGTFRLQSEALTAAQNAEVDARRQAAAKTGTLPPSIKWGDWWDTFAADRDFDSDTRAREDNVVDNHLRPHWGDTPLVDIDRQEIQDWVDSYKKRTKPGGGRYKPSSIVRYYKVFTASINAALDAGILTASPLHGVKLPKIPRTSKPYLSVDEAAQLSAELADAYAAIVEFGLETGLRPGELAGLHDDQVDKTRRIVTARTVYVPGKKKMRDHPKDGDERDVPLTSKAWAIYQRVTTGRDMGHGCGIPHFDPDHTCRHELVFRNQLGRVVIIQSLRRAMKSAAARAKIDTRAPYSWRRGFATRLRQAQADPFMIMELLGHETLEESHGYAQQGPDFHHRVQAALDDPQATGLRAVKDDSAARGTERGTKPASTPRSGTHENRRRKTS